MLSELINEYCRLSEICDDAELDYEKNPEDAKKEKAFDNAYKAQFEKYIECVNYIVNCTAGKVNFDRAKYLVNVEVKRLALKSCI